MVTDHVRFFYTGSYASDKEYGINLLNFNCKNGEMLLLDGYKGIENPTYLAVDEKRQFLFACSESEEARIHAFRIEKYTGRLIPINSQAAGGPFTCYIEVHSSGKWLFAVNYGGSVSVLPIMEEGKLGRATEIIELSGSSINEDRQEGPHPHMMTQDSRSDLVFVTDLGADRIYSYLFDKEEGKLKQVFVEHTNPGMGPRHIAFHPKNDCMFVVGELNSTVATYQIDRTNGVISFINQVELISRDFSEFNKSSAIQIDQSGKYLYASNRGHDSIAIWEIVNGQELKLIDYSSTNGEYPRDFRLMPGDGHLLAANENSHSIHAFKIDLNGTLEDMGTTMHIPSPVCIQVV